jgi:hypothetical protein
VTGEAGEFAFRCSNDLARVELDRPADAGSMMVPVMVLHAKHLQ